MEPLPDSLIQSIINSKNAGIGLTKLRQISFSIYDLQLHTDKTWITEESTPEVLSDWWAKLRKEISLIEATANTHYVASWLHLCAGYDAGYYSYLYSEVFSADIFARFLEEGILSEKIGREYRSEIIQLGASKSGYEMLHNFLRRDPDEKSFLRSLGIE